MFIEVQAIKGSLTPEQKKRLAMGITDVVVREALHPKKYIWVLIHEVDTDTDWYVDGLTAGKELLEKDKDLAQRFEALQKGGEAAVQKELKSR
jgi:phenylpyruvate tautomerase PptA (4-oxalocrotonate tautomerase family)